MLAMALDGLGCAMTKASQTFLIEQAVCRAYYTEHDPSFVTPDGRVPEALCKTEELQSRVTLFAAGLDFSMLITCAPLCSFPSCALKLIIMFRLLG
jgi:hypothetical protein